MSKLILAVRDGFMDSIVLAIAIPTVIGRDLWKIVRAFFVSLICKLCNFLKRPNMI